MPPTLQSVWLKRWQKTSKTTRPTLIAGHLHDFWGVIFQHLNFKQQFITQHITRINQLSPINRQLISNNVLYSADVQFPNILRVGFYLPTRLRRLRDDEMTRLRDHGTTRPRDYRTPRQPRSAHFAGHLPHTAPPKKRLTPPLTLRVVSRLAGTKNSTFANKSSFRHA